MTAPKVGGAFRSRAMLGFLIALGSGIGGGAAAQTPPEQVTPDQTTIEQPPAPEGTATQAPPTQGQAPQTRPWTISPSVTVQESITDNVRLVPTGREADLISAVTPDLSVSGQTRRLNMSLDANLTYDKYLNATDMDGIQYGVSGYGNADLVDQLLFLDLRSAIDVQYLTRNGITSAIARVLPNNQAEVLNNSVSPYLRHSFGDWASGELRYTLASVDYANASAGMPASPAASLAQAANLANSLTNEYTVGLHSGPEFGRFSWGLDGDYNQSSYSAQRQIDQTTETAAIEYAVVRGIGLIGKLGYDAYKDNGILGMDTANPSWRLGLHLTPGPRSSLTVEAGRRFGGAYWAGNLYYKFSPTLRLDASHDIAQTTQQAQLSAALNNLVPNSLGRLVSPITGLPASPNQQLFSYTSQSYLQKTSRATLSGQRGLTTVVVGITYQQNDMGTVSLGQGPLETQTIAEVDVSVIYQLNQQSDIHLMGTASRLFDSITSSDDTIRQVSLSYDYKLSPSLTGSLSYSYYALNDRIGTGYGENVFLVSLQKGF